MSSKETLHQHLLESQQGFIASAVLTNQRIAQSVGLHIVDLQTLGVILRKRQPMTPSMSDSSMIR